MVLLSMLLFSVFLEDTPQACDIHGEKFDGNESHKVSPQGYQLPLGNSD